MLRSSRFVLLLALLIPVSAFPAVRTVSWSAVTTYSSGAAIPSGKSVTYKVYRSKTVQFSSATQVGSTTALIYTVSGVPANQKYYWFVSATVDGVEGMPSPGVPR